MPRPDALFLLPSAVKHEPAIDAWLATQGPELGPLISRWVSKLRALGDDVREAMHDGAPTTCVGEAAFAYVAGFTKHVNVGFFMGAFLEDPDALLVGAGKRMRHVKLFPGKPADAAALERLIEVAYRDMQRRLMAVG